MEQSFLSACRVCGSAHLTPAFTIGQDNSWVFCGDAGGENGCGLLQRALVGGATPSKAPEKLSWTEQYRMRGVVSGALEMITTRDGRALDIGCGHGTLLSAYPRWITPVGIDDRLAHTGAADWGVGIAESFLSDEGQAALDEQKGDGFDIITAIGSLERTDDPVSLFRSVKSLLSEDGVFVIETSYETLALTRTLTSTFHRDASAVYSLTTLERMARDTGFRIIRGAMTEMAGGSIRIYMSHAEYRGHDYAPWFEMLARLWDEEMALALDSRQAFNAYQARLSVRAMDIAALKASISRADEFAYVLGVCPRTMASLAAGDLDYDVIAAHVGDDARDGFPEIITEEMARAAPPDYLIVPAWRRRETLEAWHDEVMEGMQLVFLEPELVVVDDDNYSAELGRALAVTDGPGSVETLRAALSAMRGPQLHVVSARAET